MRVPLLVLVLGLVACGEPAPMLHDLEQSAGWVELSGISGGVRRGRLAFARATGHLQFQLQDTDVSLIRDPSGQLQAFAGDQWRGAGEGERELFELVEAAVGYRPDGGQPPVPWRDGYAIPVGGRLLQIRLNAEPDPHQIR